MNKTQRKLIKATEHLLLSDGLTRVTTREIAREAGVTEGVIYHHFKDKAELLHAVVQEKLGGFNEVLDSLPLQVGQRTVQENLEHMLQAAYAFQFKVIPVISSLFADHQLLNRTREILNERQISPKHSIDALAAYLQAEQLLGRVSAETDPRTAAKILLGSSFHAAMLDQFFARDVNPAKLHQRIQETVSTLLTGLGPRIEENSPVQQVRNVNL